MPNLADGGCQRNSNTFMPRRTVEPHLTRGVRVCQLMIGRWLLSIRNDVSHAGVVGLYSNVAEWTESGFSNAPGSPPIEFLPPGARASLPHMRVIRGGPISTIAIASFDFILGINRRTSQLHSFKSNCVGFRCGKSKMPRFVR